MSIDVPKPNKDIDEALKGENLKMADIKQHLTGIARMIVYSKDGGSKSIKSVTEGEMKEGDFDGYARKIFVSQVIV